jgi:hypothetical protein
VGAVAAALVVGAAADEGGDSGPDRIDMSDYPPDQRERYEIFAVKCSKCHSLARPISARLTPEQWRGYVKKMARRPGSGINDEAAQRVAEFLAYYSVRRDQEKRGPADGGTPGGGTSGGEVSGGGPTPSR